MYTEYLRKVYQQIIQKYPLFVYNYLFSWNVALHAHVYLTAATYPKHKCHLGESLRFSHNI